MIRFIRNKLYFGLATLLYACQAKDVHYPGEPKKSSSEILRQKTSVSPVKFALDTPLFNKLQLHLVHNKPTSKWPVRSTYPRPGTVIPFNRVVAFYGNFFSKGMGILGEIPPEQMLVKLQSEVKKWQQADTMVPVIPALHYIAVTAQRTAGADKKYRYRMPSSEIDKTIQLAGKINALVFLDIQVGHSCLSDELPLLEKFLLLKNVHVGIDPEYSMKDEAIPCSKLGSFDATDVNFAVNYLSELVKKYNLPPKMLIVHRFTKEMLTHYKDIHLTPEVQIVLNMDGFGFPAKKIDSYKQAISNEPVQFTGFKIFYKYDKQAPSYRLMEPEEILKLYPSPVYIQYQ
jgi:hypothetical protein